MIRSAVTCVTTLCVLSLSISAQTSTPKPTAATTTTSSSSPKPSPAAAATTDNAQAAAARSEADLLADGRRAIAISLLTSLADEARGFRDQLLRARVQARVANALWGIDAERARELFRRAWEAAETVDRDGARRVAEERQKRLATPGSRGSTFGGPPPNMRGEVLRLAARRDRKLGDQFLEKLAEATKDEAKDAAVKTPTTEEGHPANYSNPNEPSAVVAKRLDLATQLIEAGDTEHALQVADPALLRASQQAVRFLSKLRDKNAAAADTRYAALLQRTASDPSADPNTTLLLSSYAFTPNFFVSVARGGTNTSVYGPMVTPDLAPALRAAFLRTAAQILLRPVPPPPDQDRTSAGQTATYFAIARLLPLFEQHAPDYVQPLRAQLAAVTTPETTQKYGSGRDRNLTEGLIPENKTIDEVQDRLERLDRAKDASERDSIYASAAQTAAMKGDERAPDFADKIEDKELRARVRAFVDFVAVGKAVDKKDPEEIVRLARSGEVTHAQRAWALTEAARLKKSETGQAIQILNEALAEARRIDDADPDRARALLAVATQLYEVDRSRTWETIFEVVKAANNTASFSGEDGGISARLQTKSSNSMTSFSASSFNLNGIFSLLAKDDFNSAISTAQNFTAEAPRSVALISIARAILDEKKKQ